MADFVSYTNSNKYKLYVTWVDHGTYVKDFPSLASLGNTSQENGRNFRVTGFRLDGIGDPLKYNIVVPQEIQGSFKLPQIGDIILIEENYREPGSPPMYVYSLYNDIPLDNYISAPVPNWGSLPNDYGHIRSHKDHNAQFSASAKSSFVKKYIKSITGYRFRKFYGHVYGTKQRFLERGKFVVRGDNVFDVEKNSPIMSYSFIETETGIDILPVNNNSLTPNQADYPNPLNVPKKREINDDYLFSSEVPTYLEKQIETDYYVMDSGIQNKKELTNYLNVLKVKNYLSYQPIIDKRYLEYLNEQNKDDNEDLIRPFRERELPAAEEYQIALRGNNKLLIQDQYGDGEQLLITLKNQYDAGFTVVHNSESGQVRIRDHLGQGVLLEANPNSPRVVTWTTERQFIDMGSIRTFNPESGETTTHGEYIYLRNGNVYGKSDTTFGRITDEEIQRDSVSQQEFALINAKNNSGFSKLIEGVSSRLSSGMETLISSSGGSGLFFRNNYDPKSTNQTLSMFNDYATEPVLTTKIYQEHQNGDVQSYLEHVVTDSSSESKIFNKKSTSSMTNTTRVDASNSQTNVTNVFEGKTRNTFKMDKDTVISTQHTSGGDATNKIEQLVNKINIEFIDKSNADIAIKAKNILIDATNDVDIKGKNVNISQN
jgi:hypothetical protein